MELIADYIKDDRYLEKLNDLTNEVFGFSFEDWVKNGYYTGEYIPYSFLDDGKIVSNVSANIMKFKYNNENKKYIQIGTVMTSYSFRNRSLASKLMKYVIEEYKDKCDAIYLFGDLKALEFYKKLGFKVINQYRYNLKKEYVGKINNNKNQFIKLTLQLLKYVGFLYTFTSKYTLKHIRLINFYKTFTTKDTIASINDSIRLVSKPFIYFSV